MWTPGFYYDTYALLNMAQSPGQVRKVAALDSEGEEAENLKKHFPGSEPFLENQKQTELKKADIGLGYDPADPVLFWNLFLRY